MAINFQSPKVIAAGVASGLALTGGLFLFKPWLAFQNVEVNDEIPTISAPATTTGDSKSDTTVTSQSNNVDGPVVLAKGDFISHEHNTTGSASIVKLPDGKHQLVFENLNTTNGPDVHVWVSAGEVVEGLAGFKSAQDKEKIDLGVIKGNQGNQVYDLPADFDITKWKSIDLWCDQFDVSFGAAPLNLESADVQTASAPTGSEAVKVEAKQTGPVQVASGDFISHEHNTTGKASIVKLPDGKHQLVFENLNTTNGPDVHVWVSAGEVVEGLAGFKSAQDKEKIDLGVIKGNQGNQVYDLPADFDITKWKSIDLWCDQFDVSFGAAPLNVA